MGFQKDQIRQIKKLMVFAAALVLLVVYSGAVGKGVAMVFRILKPFLMGGAIAFVLNLPMRAIEGRILGRWRGRGAAKLKRPVSILASVVVVFLVVTLVVATVAPQLSRAAAELGRKVPAFLESLQVELEELSRRYPELDKELAALEELEIDWDSLMGAAVDFLKNGAANVLTSTVNAASGVVSTVTDTVIAFIFALYILSQKEKLMNQGQRLMAAYLPEKWRVSLQKLLSLLYKNFSSFLTGQCMEAVILGSMFVVAMSLLRMPYAVMVGVLVAFTALIPIVGAFIGCAVGAFLILIEDPVMAVWFVLLFLLLQQIEGNLIYPRVVGSSVGLPSIWVLMAVSLGGSLFGIAGMLMFIPLLATGYTLLRDDVNARNALKSAGSAKPGRAADLGGAPGKPGGKPRRKNRERVERKGV